MGIIKGNLKQEFNMSQRKINALGIFTTVTLCALLLFCILPIHGEGGVYGKVLRLHVIGASDSKLDQSLKLSVRDAVLECAKPLLSDAETRDDAARIITSHRDEIENAAERALRARGCHDAARISVCAERYPMKDYESFCFPSGEYLSVKVMIGEAEGKNWWCVLFPRLCTDLATSKEDFAAVGFTPEQYRIITESEDAAYRIRFRLLEFFEELKGE